MAWAVEFFFSSRRRHTRCSRDWSSDVCSSDLMVPIEDVSKMVHEGKLEAPVAEEIERKYEQFRQEFTVVYRKTLTLSRELASELSYLEQEAASVLVDGVIEELKEKYPGPNVAEYLEEVRHHLLDNLDPFKEREGEAEHEEEARSEERRVG